MIESLPVSTGTALLVSTGKPHHVPPLALTVGHIGTFPVVSTLPRWIAVRGFMIQYEVAKEVFAATAVASIDFTSLVICATDEPVLTCAGAPFVIEAGFTS